MPIIKSAIKRAKQATKRRERNVGIKHDIKDAVKAFLAKPSAKGLGAAYSEIDTAVKKGLIKKNTAARRKSQLSATAKKAGVKMEATKKAAQITAVKPATKAAPAAKKPAAKKPVAAKPAAKKAPAKKPAAKKTAK